MVDATVLKWACWEVSLKIRLSEKAQLCGIPRIEFRSLSCRRHGFESRPRSQEGIVVESITDHIVAEMSCVLVVPSYSPGWSSDRASALNLKGRIKRLWGS